MQISEHKNFTFTQSSFTNAQICYLHYGEWKWNYGMSKGRTCKTLHKKLTVQSQFYMEGSPIELLSTCVYIRLQPKCAVEVCGQQKRVLGQYSYLLPEKSRVLIQQRLPRKARQPFTKQTYWINMFPPLFFFF